jgi:hypothetical protein
VVLHFPVPPLQLGWQRTVLLEVTGYYSVIVFAEGDLQSAAFRGLTDVPAGVACFTLEWLRAGGRD